MLRIYSEPEDSSRYGEVGTDGKVKEVLMKGRGRDGAQQEKVSRRQGKADWKPTETSRLQGTTEKWCLGNGE